MRKEQTLDTVILSESEESSSAKEDLSTSPAVLRTAGFAQDDTSMIDDKLITLSQMVAEDKLSSTAAKEVLAENPKAAGDVQSGEMKAIGFLVGQVMKQSQGKANPGLATKLIKKQLGI